MKQERFSVYVWVTWLSRLIAGEQQCEFQSWFKAHFKHDKIPTDFSLTKWKIKHNQLLHKRRGELEKKGYVVKIEDQNSFRLDLQQLDVLEVRNWKFTPKGVTVSGKVDIIASKDQMNSIIEDCKTGKPKNSDQVQVMLYMMFLPQCIKEYGETIFDGYVRYKDSEVPIFHTDIDEDLKKVVWDVIKRISATEPCRKTPSYNECNFCDISKEDCSERVE